MCVCVCVSIVRLDVSSPYPKRVSWVNLGTYRKSPFVIFWMSAYRFSAGGTASKVCCASPAGCPIPVFSLVMLTWRDTIHLFFFYVCSISFGCWLQGFNIEGHILGRLPPVFCKALCGEAWGSCNTGERNFHLFFAFFWESATRKPGFCKARTWIHWSYTRFHDFWQQKDALQGADETLWCLFSESLITGTATLNLSKYRWAS